MAYVEPSGNTVNFQFAGDSYTPPRYTAVDFQLSDAGLIANASGFCSTQFGTPTEIHDQLGQATGFVNEAQFGLGIVTANRTQQATGFATSSFGTPFGIFARSEQASGFSTTSFGTANNGRTQPATGACNTHFGTPWSPTPLLKLGDPTHARGQRAEAISTPAPDIVIAADTFVDATGLAQSDIGPVYWKLAPNTVVESGALSGTGTAPDKWQYTEFSAFSDAALTEYGITSNTYSTCTISLTVRTWQSYPTSIAQGIDFYIGWASDQAWSLYYERLIRYSRNNFGANHHYLDIAEWDESTLDNSASSLLAEPTLWPAGGEVHTITFEVAPTGVLLYIDDAYVTQATLPTTNTRAYNGELYVRASQLDVVGISVTAPPVGGGTLPVTHTGVPSSYIAFHPYPIYPATRFGFHMLAGFPRSGVASTLAATQFGIPRKPVVITAPAHTYVRASALPRPKLGTPALVVQPTTVDATGTATTSFGTPTVGVAEYASGFTTSTLGTPVRIHITKVSAITASRFGTPVSGKTYAAATTHKTVFGTPRGFRIGDKNASSLGKRTVFGWPRGFYPSYKRAYSMRELTRFGRPAGYSRHSYPVTAIRTTQLGIPTSFETYHVSMLAPTRRFGKPLLKRSTLC